MIPNLIRVIFISIILVILSGCATNQFQSKQLELAKELGVKISDYPYESSFPEGYFSTVLIPGLKLKEVHSTIKGYEKVYHCKNYEEIYYYFSVDDQEALRFAIFYDTQALFERFEGEDRNSRTLFITNCEIGLIKE